VWLPTQLARGLARLFERLHPPTAEMVRNAAGVSYLARADKARRELGWEPRPIEAGIPETIEWLRSQP
jgi:nucleoside-diphosphate-sugar epimerase